MGLIHYECNNCTIRIIISHIFKRIILIFTEARLQMINNYSTALSLTEFIVHTSKRLDRTSQRWSLRSFTSGETDFRQFKGKRFREMSKYSSNLKQVKRYFTHSCTVHYLTSSSSHVLTPGSGQVLKVGLVQGQGHSGFPR